LPLPRRPPKVSGNAVDTSLLAQELEPLNAQIEQIERQREAYAGKLRVVEAELEKISAVRQRFEALGGVCRAFDKLEELKAGNLFWEGIPQVNDVAGHLAQVRGRVDRFEQKISGILESQATLQKQIGRRNDELNFLHEEVGDVYEREERRQQEFVIEREISAVPPRAMIMPWTKEAESEKRFRRSVLVALLACFLFGAIIPVIKVPIPDRSVVVAEIPERLAKLVKQAPPKPVEPPKPLPKPPREEPKQAREDVTKPRPADQPPPKKPNQGGGSPKPSKVASASGGGGVSAARKKAERVGVLAFKNTFKDLMAETPVARLGTEARLTKGSPRVAGQAVAQRSLVAMQAKGGSSGGIGNAGVSRNIGNGNVDRLGGGGIGRGGGGNGNGEGFAQVESAIANLSESSRPLSEGPRAGRTDEEIQIVFDRYKATLYRIYNKELRINPTLRGKILLRICIETSGAVSICEVESTDLASSDLIAKIVARIKMFNFGAKEGVPKMTILYPIDFLPAG
jgi:outer membrane biosynthesis protein TonB